MIVVNECIPSGALAKLALIDDINRRNIYIAIIVFQPKYNKSRNNANTPKKDMKWQSTKEILVLCNYNFPQMIEKNDTNYRN